MYSTAGHPLGSGTFTSMDILAWMSKYTLLDNAGLSSGNVQKILDDALLEFFSLGYGSYGNYNNAQILLARAESDSTAARKGVEDALAVFASIFASVAGEKEWNELVQSPDQGLVNLANLDNYMWQSSLFNLNQQTIWNDTKDAYNSLETNKTGFEDSLNSFRTTFITVIGQSGASVWNQYVTYSGSQIVSVDFTGLDNYMKQANVWSQFSSAQQGTWNGVASTHSNFEGSKTKFDSSFKEFERVFIGVVGTNAWNAEIADRITDGQIETFDIGQFNNRIQQTDIWSRLNSDQKQSWSDVMDAGDNFTKIVVIPDQIRRAIEDVVYLETLYQISQGGGSVGGDFSKALTCY